MCVGVCVCDRQISKWLDVLKWSVEQKVFSCSSLSDVTTCCFCLFLLLWMKFLCCRNVLDKSWRLRVSAWSISVRSFFHYSPDTLIFRLTTKTTERLPRWLLHHASIKAGLQVGVWLRIELCTVYEYFQGHVVAAARAWPVTVTCGRPLVGHSDWINSHQKHAAAWVACSLNHLHAKPRMSNIASV